MPTPLAAVQRKPKTGRREGISSLVCSLTDDSVHEMLRDLQVAASTGRAAAS
ncbi:MULTISPECIES: hypothetical protein [unclassified Roseovarius]|uniref:hypothetical protein n=1 Tax=unclassified Roseovarius TaxID=2614913 RepID=UPI0018FE36F4|nr:MULTISPECIES: hypothetical protein [unclassified Roseovarius]